MPETRTLTPDRSGQDDVVIAALRAWARGLYPLEAAVELLVRAHGGRLLHGPWIVRADPGSAWQWWFDASVVPAHAGVLSGGERRTLAVAASLADVDVPVSLDDALSGLDRDTVALVLAAVAHAAGTHEHSRLVPDPDGRWVDDQGHRFASRRLGCLYPWPQPGGHA